MSDAMKQAAIPRRPSTSGDLAGAVRALSDVQIALRSMPAVDLKDCKFIAGSMSTNNLRISTSVRVPRAVMIGGVWLTTDPTSAASPTAFHWRRGGSNEVIVDTLSGLTSGGEYTMTLHIEGDR